ncbi:PH domain-containing protein [Longimicrobium sp.]|uniref:PH domain-containing protein n=1 Tax=Longimicrobium sp. TaxID=2029185 RepID=UPI002E2F0957|nr:PH domain-containing protein [Longimicrobium sp.]HEX6042540.1 PH domain-containing protein [Longimicrobium sp.]
MTDAAAAPPAPSEAETEQLDPGVELLWQINAALGWAVWIGVATATLMVFERPVSWALTVSFVALMHIMHVPPRRCRHFTFRVGATDVRVVHGWLWRTESVVLHSRIQHVDTRQGPIERMMGLATVVVYTAGTVGAAVPIPGLSAARAEALRDDLVRLSGTDDAV